VKVTDSEGTPFKCGFQDAAYYLRQGSQSGRWLVYLGSSTEGNNVYATGGGICGSVDECKSIAAERPESYTRFEGILSNHASNPFKDWQVVFVPWCSGFAFATGLDKALTDGGNLQAQGPSMLSRILGTLNTADAEVLVLGGSGTGGMQALMRANTVKTETGAREVMVIADSAFLVNNRTADVFEEAYTLSKDNPIGDFSPNIDSACRSSNTANPWKCLWPETFLEYTYSASNEIPVFIAQSLYDVWALENLVEKSSTQGIATCFNPTTFAPTGDCEDDSIDLQLAHAYKKRVREGLERRFHLKDDSGSEMESPAKLGMWIITCPAHGLLCHDDTYINPEPSHWFVQHKDLDRAIEAWVEDNLNPEGPTDNHVFIDGNNGNDWSSDLQCPTRTTEQQSESR